MKIDVYQEQYKSKQASHELGKIGFGFDPSIIKTTGDALISASIKKMEQDDALNSARIEADTAHEADKMLQNYKKTANPDDFVGDMERQQKGIQTLIQDKSKEFKTKAAQNAFVEKMTRGIEEPYVKQSLFYSYELQATTASKKVQAGLDSYKAALLAGNSLINPQDAIGNALRYIDTVAAPYHMTQQQIDAMKTATIKDFVVSYAYGIMDKDPYAIRDMLLGNSFDKFKEAKEAEGKGFTMEDFWANQDLQDEYRNSEYGANWINISEHLDYPTRMQLGKLADETISNQEKEALKAKYAANAMSEYDLNTAQEAMVLRAETDGSYDPKYAGACTRTTGSVAKPVSMGEAHIGNIDKSKGHYVTKAAKTFANGLAGAMHGFDTWLTSSVRPEATNSKHKDGSAVDIQIFKRVNGKEVWSLDGSIKAYAEAVKLYGNNMRKGGTLFEVNPAKLSYIKQELTKMNIPLDYVNWKQSATYGAAALKENRQHIHFGINPKADYTKTASGTGKTYNFSNQLSGKWFDYYKTQGNSDEEAYGKALEKEDEIEAKRYAYNMKQAIITGKGTSSGRAADPATYTKQVVAFRNSILANKSLSDREKVRKLKAISYLEKELPKAQKQFEKDPAAFVEKNYNVTDPKTNAAIQAGVYGIAPNEVRTMTDNQAKVEAAKLTRATGEQFVALARKYSMSDITAIAKHIDDPNKAGLFQYVSMASDKGKADIKNAISNWDNVKAFIKQEKNSGTSKVFGKQANWEAYIQGELRKNAVVSKYLTNLDKTNPGASSRFINAMTTLYAYRAYQKGSAGDPKVIINDMAQDFIGSNFNHISIRNPYWGVTDIEVSNKAFGGNETNQIKEVLNVVNALGINPNKIGAFDQQALLSNSEKIDSALQMAMNKRNKLDHDANVRSAKLYSNMDGMSVSFAFGDTKQTPYSGNIMRTTNGTKAKLQLRDLVEIDKQAERMILKWKAPAGSAYSGYKIPGAGRYTSTLLANKYPWLGGYVNSKKAAKTAAIEHLLTNKYPWLGKSDYTQFHRIVSKFSKDGAIEASYDVYYNADGKEISRKKVRSSNK